MTHRDESCSSRCAYSAMCIHSGMGRPGLKASAPVGENQAEIGGVDLAVAVEIKGAGIIRL